MTDVTGAERLSEETALPTPNLPLLRKVLDHIDAHPEEWDQTTVANECGTAFCVAGHAVQLAGDHLAVDDQGDVWLNGERGASVCSSAAEHLGLTRGERGDLFAIYNSRSDVQRVARRIAARAGERL